MCSQVSLFQTGKYIFLILVLTIATSTESLSQNVGIGTTTPQAKFDVVNSFRVGGPLKFMKYDSSSGSLILNNSIIIGANVPNPSPLSTLDVRRGTKADGTASFWGSQNHTHINHLSDEHTYIRGGKYNSHVILNDIPAGYVGIGVVPAYKLDVHGQMRLRRHGVNAGIWLNNSVDSPTTFIGMEDDNHVGFGGFRGGAGWKFTMNTKTGALKINGTEGTPGQLLQSQGSSSPAMWQSVGQIIKTYRLNTLSTSTLVEVKTADEYELPDSLNISVEFASRLIISVNYVAINKCPFVGTCDGRYSFYFRVNGSPSYGQGRVDFTHVGAGHDNRSLSNFILEVGPGTYQLKFFTRKDSSTGSVNYVAGAKFISVIVIPL